MPVPQSKRPRTSSLARSRASGSSPFGLPGPCQSRWSRSNLSSKSSAERESPVAALFTSCAIIASRLLIFVTRPLIRTSTGVSKLLMDDGAEPFGLLRASFWIS